MKTQRVALVHDYLNEAGGAERVLRVLSEMYPKAVIYTAFVKNGSAKRMFADRVVVESGWGWLLKMGRLYSYLRFLLPWIWKSLDLTAYDLIVTSTSGGYIARGFRVSEQARVVAYCHTPPKWLYGYVTPTGAMGKWWGRGFMLVFGPFLRYFDYTSAQRVNQWVANSREVAGRIKKFYRREAEVVYPPVEVKGASTKVNTKRGDYYLLVTRITGAKGVNEAVRAAKKAKVRLIVVGEIVEQRLSAVVRDAAVEYVGRVSDPELAEYYSRARGFLALAQDEDFGMTVVEAMQRGTPVLALDSGGYKETVVAGKTGVFVKDLRVESVAEGIAAMERTVWDYKAIGEWGQSFSRARFERAIRKVVGD